MLAREGSGDGLSDSNAEERNNFIDEHQVEMMNKNFESLQKRKMMAKRRYHTGLSKNWQVFVGSKFERKNVTV